MFLDDPAILADIVGDVVSLPVKVVQWSAELGNDYHQDGGLGRSEPD